MSEFTQEMDVVAMSFVDDRFDLAECFSKFDHNHAFKVEGSSSMNDYFKFMVEHKQRDETSPAIPTNHSKFSMNSVLKNLFKR